MRRLERCCRRRSAREGSALIVVVMLLAALGVLLGSLSAGVHSRLARSHNAWREEVAGALAEAGLHAAAARLAEFGVEYSGEKGTPLGDGEYSVAIQRGAGPGEFLVSATGELRDGTLLLHRARTEARVRIQDHRIIAIEYIRGAFRKRDDL